jgi:hypothetical protein
MKSLKYTSTGIVIKTNPDTGKTEKSVSNKTIVIKKIGKNQYFLTITNDSGLKFNIVALKDGKDKLISTNHGLDILKFHKDGFTHSYENLNPTTNIIVSGVFTYVIAK